MIGPRSTKVLFYGLAVPLGVAGRAVWRRRLGLRLDPDGATYWRTRGDRVTGADLRSQR